MEQEKYSLIDIQYVKDFKEPKALMRIWRDELGYHTSTEEFGEGDKSFAAYFLNRTKVPRIPCLVVSGSAYYDPFGRHRLRGVPADRFPRGNLIFESDPISGCDRSIASFIGIIASLDYQEQSGDRRRVYCDDLGAMHWLNRGEVETECKMGPNDEAYYLLQKGVDYLHENITFEHHIAFWGDKAVRPESGQLRGMHGERLPSHAADVPDERGEGRKIQEGIQILQGIWRMS